MREHIGAIIMAAGKGKRMKAKDINKVAVSLADKPMILHSILLLESLQLQNIVVVVGFAKESVMKALSGTSVLFAEQRKRLGTAHAVFCGLKKLPPSITDVLVLGGDDSAFYSKEILNKLIDTHFNSSAAVTFLTIEKDDPTGLGRVVRDLGGKVTAIVEEKDATLEQRQIHEINPACYVFSRTFLSKYLAKVEKSPVTGEYYLTSLIDTAMKHNQKIATVQGGKLSWQGVNTKEELEEAEKLFTSLNHISTASSETA